MNQNQTTILLDSHTKLNEYEFSLFHLSPGIINIVFLLIGTCQMYFGIDINHPIYSTLFCNLFITLISSIIDVFIFPFISAVKYIILVNGNNLLCLLFHCCSWSVSSVLRYLYIIHANWLHTKFPEAKLLSSWAILSICLIFSTCSGIFIGTVRYVGWPNKRGSEMTLQERALTMGTFFTLYLLLLGTNCFFYILILRQRGKLGRNRVEDFVGLSNKDGSKHESQHQRSPDQFQKVKDQMAVDNKHSDMDNNLQFEVNDVLFK